MPTGAASTGGAGTYVMYGGSREELRFTPGDGTVKSLLAGRSELVSNRSWFELLNDATVYGLF